jgi:ankyrin repeat protein
MLSYIRRNPTLSIGSLVLLATLCWIGLRASHLLLPDLWLPSSPEHIVSQERPVRVNPHIYDQQWFDAARAGRTDISHALLTAGFPVNSRSSDGYTALVLATYHGKSSEVALLLGAAADPCIPDHNGNTALMGALFKGEMEVARLLIGRCPVNQANNSGQTALAFAALFGRLDFIPVLVAEGADVNHTDAHGETALGIVVGQGNDAAADALRQLGATETN